MSRRPVPSNETSGGDTGPGEGRPRPGRVPVAGGVALALLAAAAASAPPGVGIAQEPAPAGAGPGEGPYDRLVIRGVTLVDGTGAPPRGPVDVVVRGDTIAGVRVHAAPDMPEDRVGEAEEEADGRTRVIEGRGKWLLPGFVDLHAHMHGDREWTPPEYVWKLWLAHGVTTIRDPGSGSGLDWTLRVRERSARGEIAAPRVYAYAFAGSGWDGGALRTPAVAREWVRWAAEEGADGIKVRDTYDPEIVRALLDEAAKQGLGSAAHLTQMGVARTDALDAARAGLTTLEHWYGLPEALFEDRTVQDFPLDYDYSDEYDRFREAGRLWLQAAEPGSGTWNSVRDELLELGLVLTPTLTIYEANRDVMRAREAEWHETYTLPELRNFFRPSPESHGSYWYRWTTGDEIAWKENFRRWMTFLEDYKNHGGSVCTGSDSGYIYKLYGFGYVRELELLQEAGFHPLEVVRAATLCGARALAEPAGEEVRFGAVRPGLKADLVLVGRNPIRDFKVLYGTGAVRLDRSSGEVRRVGGVEYTIKDGIVYDARALLNDVAGMVRRRDDDR